MHGDMVAPARRRSVGDRPGRADSGGGPSRRSSTFATPTAPSSPHGNYDACTGKRLPKFECTFAPTLVECQRQIQAYLDAWYADFNIVFTLTRPTSGKYYTEVVSSGGGAWCKARRQGRGRRAVPVQGPAGRRRVHVPGRPQRAARPRSSSRRSRRTCSVSSTRSTRTTSCSRASAPTTTGFVDENSGGHGRPLRPRQAELVQDDEEGAGRLARRPEAVRVRLRRGHAGSRSVRFLTPKRGRPRWATTSR